MGGATMQLLLQTNRTLTQQLHIVLHARVAHIGIEGSKHHHDADETHHGNGGEVAVVVGQATAGKDRAREDLPLKTRTFAALLALLLFGLLALLLLLQATGFLVFLLQDGVDLLGLSALVAGGADSKYVSFENIQSVLYKYTQN